MLGRRIEIAKLIFSRLHLVTYFEKTVSAIQRGCESACSSEYQFTAIKRLVLYFVAICELLTSIPTSRVP
jgi:hypothetical protein